MEEDDEIEHIYLDDEDKQPLPPQDAHVVSALDNEEERHKLRRILIGITLVAAMLTFVRGIELQRFVADFMAVFFITFAAIKFSDIEGFAHAYRNYDLIARVIRPWGYIMPFILVILGFWYLLSDPPSRLNIITLILTGIALVGALESMRKHSKQQYAYHKTLLRLPFNRINLMENLSMFVLAGVSLFL